jgi:MFS family permease
MAAAGVGAGAGGLLLAGVRIRKQIYHRLLPVGLVVFSLSLGAFALSTNYALSLVLLAIVGAGGIVYFNASNTLVQLAADDRHRGRVMSLYTFMHQGTATAGSLILGVIATQHDTPAALLTGAVVCLVTATIHTALGRARRPPPVKTTAGESVLPSSAETALPPSP